MNQTKLSQWLAQQPLDGLQRVAAQLGWNGLVLCHHQISEADVLASGLSFSTVIWFETTDPKFHLQINPKPHGQVEHFQATVLAERYGIIHTDWQDFGLSADVEEIAARLERWLHRRNFKSAAWREWFFQQRPEIATKMRRSKNRRGKDVAWRLRLG